MSISFSGLASGLDTSSWVESLVALKQAKIDTLEEEKETVLLSQETLNNIKSFFTSFRSMIEKVTDAKFGVASMDLFAQNLATSSKLDVLTASATSEAEEATYNVLVDKLASNTQANSNYTYLTTIVQTTTATSDSKLINLGVKAGNIGVNVGGIEHQISITENDTIATFIEKLNKVGVEANYNEKTGIFSMNLDDDAINDIDNTGIVSALHLEGVNKGYTSNNLETSQTETVYTPATEATLMKDLGVNAGEIIIHANDQDYTITITEDSTFGSFIADLQANNIDAVLDKEGIFSITDAVITDEGTTNILDALGLEVDIYGKTQTTEELTYQTITTEVTTATSDTLLKDIGDGITITDGQTVIVKDASNKITTITVGETTTIGDLISSMNSAGLNASLTTSGRIEITEGSITGGTFDAVTALGLKQITSSMGVTGDVLYTGSEAFADESTKFSDLGITGDKTFTINNKDGSAVGTFTVSESDTIGDFLNILKSNDINGKISNGVIELNSTIGNYVIGELADALGISASTTEIVDTTQSSTVAITYTGTVVATGSTTMGELGIGASSNSPGGFIEPVTRLSEEEAIAQGYTVIKTAQQLQDMQNNLSGKYILMNDIDLEGFDWNAVGNSFANSFSGELNGNGYVVKNLTINKPTEDYQGLFGYILGATIQNIGLENIDIKGYDYIGGVAGVSNHSIISNCYASGSLNAGDNSFVGGLVGGLIYNSSINNSYASSNISANPRVSKAGGLVGYMLNSIINNSYASSNISGVHQVGGLVGQMAGSSINNSFASGNISGAYIAGGLVYGVSDNSSINNSFASCNISGAFSAGGLVCTMESATINNCYTSSNVEAYYYQGELVAESIGSNNTINGFFEDYIGHHPEVSSGTYTGTIKSITTQELNNLFVDGTLWTPDNYIMIKNGADTLGGFVVDSSMTIQDVFDKLEEYGITGTIENGVISLSSASGSYIVGDIATQLGIGVTEETMTITSGVTSTSTVQINYTQTIVATGSSNLGELGVFESKRVVNQSSFISGETYYLSSSEDLVKLQDLVNSGANTTNVTFELMNDIDMSGITFRGIGTNSTNAFKGTFDGNNHIISNLTINTSEDYAGLFVRAQGANIYSIGIENCNITGGNFVGGLIGEAWNSTKISQTYVTGSINGADNVGGLVGKISDKTFIKDSYSNITVGGNNYIGGLVGYVDNGLFTNSYASGNVSGYGRVGGLIGECYSSSQINNSYSNAQISGTIYTGGFIGYVYNTTSFANSYYDKQSSGQASSVGDGTYAGTITGVTTSELNNLISNGTLPNFTNGFNWINESKRVVNQTTFVSGETYYLTTKDDLVKLQDLVNSGVDTTNVTFELMNDIDMEGVNFRGIGKDSTKAFKGTFNGNNNIISNLTINTTEDNVGLFGYVNSGIIDSIGLENVNITGNTYVGGLIGYSFSSTINNSYTFGYITGNDFVGGLIGMQFISGSITNSYASSSVTGNNYIGGLIGAMSYCNITNSYATGSVNGNTSIGGLVGGSAGGNITNSYATGYLSGNTNIGGLVGEIISGSNTINGYFDKDTTGQTVGVGSGSYTGNVTGLANNQLATLIVQGTLPDYTPDDVIIVKNENNTLGYIRVDNNTTIDEIFIELDKYGITGSINDGVISLNSTNRNYITGNIANELGIGINQTTTTAVVGKTSTSTAQVTYTQTSVATASSTLAEIGVFNENDVSGFIDPITRLTEQEALSQGYTIIKTAQQLQNIQNNLNGKYILINDIDLEGFDWTAIGNSSNAFSGELNGNGYVVKNLTINKPDEDYQGLFGYTDAAIIKNIGLNNVNITGSKIVGSLVGMTVNNTIISNSYAEGNINASTSYSYIGGIVGNAVNSNIRKSYSLGSITGDGYYSFMGGVVGMSSTTSINNSYSLAKITANDTAFLGGLVGGLENSVINTCFAFGIIKGNGEGGSIGGLLGASLDNSTINNCYTSSTIRGGYHSNLGGFIGAIIDTTYINNSYSSSSLSGFASTLGGFIGNNTSGNFTGCYFDAINAGTTVSAGYGNSTGVTTISTSELNNKIINETIWTPKNILIIKNESATLGIVQLKENMTLEKIYIELSNYGITGSINNGKISLNGNGTNYVLGDGANDLGIGLDGYNNTDSNFFNATQSGTLSATTTLSNLNLFSANVTIMSNGTQHTITLSSTSSMQDLIDDLKDYGITASITDGKITIEGNDNNYILGMDSNLQSKLNLSGPFSIAQVINSYTNTNSDRFADEKVSTLNNSTTLNNLGISSNTYITVVQNGTESVITLSSDSTIGDLINRLSNKGILGSVQDGKLTLKGSNLSYIKDMSQELQNALKLEAGEGYTWNSSIENGWINDDSNYFEYEKEDIKISEDTILNNLGDLNNGNGNLIVNQADGSKATISVDATKTVGEFFEQLKEYGLTGSIDSDGKVTISGLGNVYLEQTSGGSNILEALKLSNVITNVQTITVNDTSDTLKTSSRGFANNSTTLENLGDINGNSLNFTGNTVDLIVETTSSDGTQKFTLTFSKTQSLNDVINRLSQYGINAYVDSNGRFSVNSSTLDNFVLSGELGNFLVDNYSKYQSDTLNIINRTTLDASATRDTLLSELGVTTGEYYIYNNGVKFTAFISSGDTLGDFLEKLKQFGLETSISDGANGSVITVLGKGNSYISKSYGANASNIVDVLFPNGVEESNEYRGQQESSEVVTTTINATKETLLSAFDTPWGGSMLTAEGDLAVVVNGQESILKISANETFGSFIEKLEALGVKADLIDGKLILQGGYNDFTINTANTTSSLLTTLGLTYNADLGGYVASNDTVMSTTTSIEEKTLSVANYADLNTKMSLLNISDGSLTVYRDGQKATIQINSEETFGDLRSRLSSAFSDLELEIKDGYLNIYSKTEGVKVEVGATTDTSNFSAITGITKNENGNVVSARELYQVNNDSIITQSGLFRRGDVTEGTFTVGNASFTINDKTTLADIISQINSSEEANATAYWDSVDGKFVIKSRTTGAAYVNIEAGTSNFTDIMGYTTSTWKPDGTIDVTKMNINAQQVGDNAKLSINGTNYTSTSNTITSDISRIKGLTINLKGLTEGSAVTITVERDKETLANAISDVVDSYNELMKNVDEAIAIDGELHDQTTLKLIRNQLRNMMTSSDIGTTVFRNLDAIGIKVDSASGNNISTSNESIVNLTFDKDKFFEAYEADQQAVKDLLIGSENNKGVFTKVEELVESSLQSVTGYFEVADKSYTNEVKNIERKVVNATKDMERYKERLEAKFSSMDLLIANMQQQYSSFLGF